MSIVILIAFTCLMPTILAENNAIRNVLACENANAVPECPRGYVIEVMRAVYGRQGDNKCPGFVENGADCTADNSLDIVKLKCNRKQTCTVTASNSEFGDPCPRVIKYLEVRYRCNEAGEMITKSCRQDEILEIKCPSNQYLWIANAWYGNEDPETCHATTAFSSVKTSCNRKPTCTVTASNSVFGDPCPYKIKYLEVSYRCSETGEVITKSVREDRTLTINCPSNQYLMIANAWYGIKKPESCSADTALSSVETSCNRKQACAVKASNSVFGDPCPYIIKDLEVSYRCNETGEVITKSVREDHTLKINCPSNQYLMITNAWYGIKKHKSCNANTAFNYVETRCDFLNICAIAANDGVFGDPCAGTIKHFEVDYQCFDRGWE